METSFSHVANNIMTYGIILFNNSYRTIFKSRGLQLPIGSATYVNQPIPLCRRFKPEIPPPKAIASKAGIEERRNFTEHH
jgi:hypothetical protein